DLILAFVCDEEYASIGTAHIAGRVSADAAIVTEPTGLDLCIAHKGFAWLEIGTHGVAAHGSLPEEGVDAIAAMGPVLCGISDLQESLERRAAHPLLGTPSVHASLISGGSELSTYPGRCTLAVERRTVPGESDAQGEAECRALRQAAGRGGPEFPASLTMGVTRQPFEIAPDHPFVRLVSAAVSDAAGRAPAMTGAFGWMDSALLAAAGIPTVIFGPDGAGAHADEEWVDLASTELALRALDETAARFCA
ncbi:MAG: M20/M25/M40 family metallo-hydrolase, partial [Chloroflexota bacterium]